MITKKTIEKLEQAIDLKRSTDNKISVDSEGYEFLLVELIHELIEYVKVIEIRGEIRIKINEKRGINNSIEETSKQKLNEVLLKEEFKEDRDLIRLIIDTICNANLPNKTENSVELKQ